MKEKYLFRLNMRLVSWQGPFKDERSLLYMAHKLEMARDYFSGYRNIIETGRISNYFTEEKLPTYEGEVDLEKWVTYFHLDGLHTYPARGVSWRPEIVYIRDGEEIRDRIAITDQEEAFLESLGMESGYVQEETGVTPINRLVFKRDNGNLGVHQQPKRVGLKIFSKN